METLVWMCVCSCCVSDYVYIPIATVDATVLQMRNGLSLLRGNRFEWICGARWNRAVSTFCEYTSLFFLSLSASSVFPWWHLFQSIESFYFCCRVGTLLGLWAPPPWLCGLFYPYPFSFPLLSLCHWPFGAPSLSHSVYLYFSLSFSFSLRNSLCRDCSNTHSQSWIFHKHMGTCKRGVLFNSESCSQVDESGQEL